MFLITPLGFSPGENWRLESCKDAQTPHIPPSFGELLGDPGQEKAGWVGKRAEICEDGCADSRLEKKKKKKKKRKGKLENQDKSQAVLAGWDLKEIFFSGMFGKERDVK